MVEGNNRKKKKKNVPGVAADVGEKKKLAMYIHVRMMLLRQLGTVAKVQQHCISHYFSRKRNPELDGDACVKSQNRLGCSWYKHNFIEFKRGF